MKKTFIRFFVTAFSLSLPLISYGAEAVKLRHAVSIYTDEKGISLRQPESIASDNESLFIVADTQNGRLLRYTYRDKTVKGGTEIKPPQLSYPRKVKINSKGEIFALDGRQNRIVRLTPEGGFKDYLNPVGMPSPEAFTTMSFTIDSNDHIYILDTLSKRVIRLNTEGSYQGHIAFPPEFGFFTDLSVDAKGSVFIIDCVQAKVFSAAREAVTFTPLSESLKEYVRFPISIAVDKQGIIYLVDHNDMSVLMLSQSGSFLGQQLNMGWNEGLLYYPTQLCVNENGEIFIADKGNNRIQIFTIIK